ncbi:ornithine cyclodeaminase family protein [Shewanella fidelis]|uniref:Ornithine cyclodeaminase family protein n=1 Tax=Shewanella fidelis TaxID=173509 RepID=A0AAW8NJJ8_9GAMM|nr:ornithine cyclodeaminase family protein [Shewanella fidelis]MDR8523042.1 ornithine cyclodeaminase family protein [Shewanella fidelis]MDW4811632.1 ornithine cyclodeaminase family protein [Shewanella fidelis]MDW4815753.1 ornithine cyclodeaminase family protein [Shewanella fidelis]MDW4819843.1 ornithine cyclodeaminase family protein [Shewanella fidelis]MDW4824183.1 ornithine cyclodeaminase family protein [Shewanella fidelis]
MRSGIEYKVGNMIYLSEAQTSKLISHQLAYNAVKQAFVAAIADKASLFPVVNAQGANPDEMFSLKSAATPELVGWKTGSYWPDNHKHGLPCHGTNVFLLDPLTGMLQAVIAATTVNAYRTAAADAVAVNYLARLDAAVLTVFGTGHQAEYEVLAVCQVRTITKVYVVGRSICKAENMAKRLVEKGINAQVCDAKSACEQADIIVTATTAQSALFEAEWVKPGCHISAMGADKVGKQELPVALYQHARLFCDFAAQSIVIGEFQHSRNIAITEIGRVIDESVLGRQSDDEITIFDSSGIAIQDLFVASHILALSQS